MAEIQYGFSLFIYQKKLYQTVIVKLINRWYNIIEKLLTTDYKITNQHR